MHYIHHIYTYPAPWSQKGLLLAGQHLCRVKLVLCTSLAMAIHRHCMISVFIHLQIPIKSPEKWGVFTCWIISSLLHDLLDAQEDNCRMDEKEEVCGKIVLIESRHKAKKFKTGNLLRKRFYSSLIEMLTLWIEGRHQLQSVILSFTHLHMLSNKHLGEGKK